MRAAIEAHTVLEGEEVKDAVEDGDGGRERQQPGVGVHEHCLKCVRLLCRDRSRPLALLP